MKMMKKIMCVFAAIGFFASSGSAQADDVNGDYVCWTEVNKRDKRGTGQFEQIKITDEEILPPILDYDVTLPRKIVLQTKTLVIAKLGGENTKKREFFHIFSKRNKRLSVFDGSSVPYKTMKCHQFTPLK
jgi:hypothetical protein